MTSGSRLAAAVVALSLLLAGGCAPAPARKAGEVVVGTEGAYPPWNFTRADGALAGFEPELLAALCPRARMTCRLVAQDWNGMIGALDAGKIDVIADSVVITPARGEVVTFSRPYARTASVFVTADPAMAAAFAGVSGAIDYDRPGPAFDRRIARLRRVLTGRTIGVQASGVYEEYLTAHMAGVATIRTYRTAGERDLDLILGRVDLTLEDSAYMKPLLAAPGSEALRIVGPALSGGMFGAGEAFAVRKGDHAMKARLDRALATLIADGTIRRLSLKWLHEDATP